MVYVLDTHPVIWYVDGDARLSANAKTALDSASVELVIPTMALVEIQYLYTKGKIKTDPIVVRQKIIAAKNALVHPLDEKVVSKFPSGLNIHDAIIVATALVYRDIFQQPVTLITKDGEITRSGLIQTLW